MQMEELAKRIRKFLFDKRLITSVIILFVVLSGLSLAWPSFAQFESGQENINAVAASAGVGESPDLITIIGRIINIALGFVGVILLIIMLYSGFEYMTAGGDATKVQNATTRIRNAIIGLIIIFLSFAIVNFVLGIFAPGGGGGFFQPSGFGFGGPGGFGQWGNSGSLGEGVIEYHFPERDQKGVPRNTAISITFKEPIDPASFITNWDPAASPLPYQLNSDLIKIHPQDNASQNLLPDQARVSLSPDGRSVIIKPNEPLGNSNSNTWYEVALEGGADGIKNASGTALFVGSFDSGYTWSFEVSTEIDNTPPKVISHIPYSAGTYARNIVVQINFSEPILPMSASGFYDPNVTSGNFQNITVSSDQGNGSQLVAGEYRISNGYRTVEFITTDECGTNSCLITMYCLPANGATDVTVKSATLSATPPLAAEVGAFGFDGVVDMAGNSLDGNGNGIAEGPPPGGNDDKIFAFATNDEIFLDPPVITAITPSVLEGNIAVDLPADVTFDSILLGHTINSGNVSITRAGPAEVALGENTWYYYSSLNQLNANGDPITAGEEPVSSRISIKHRPFLPSDVPALNQDPWEAMSIYAPVITHRIMNIYQNCFNPAASDLDKNGIPFSGGPNNPNLCNETPWNNNCETSPAWKPAP
ncbi:MAG: Ig-like domain-containing protein [Patescibacteria group bacterium]|nr:Ig-like domain-containing protein [Patescibacteria group bacterium]